METEIKKIVIYGYRHLFSQDYFDSKLKEIETLGVNEQYSLKIESFRNAEEEITKIFETVFVKQKPNLIKMVLSYLKLLPNSFKSFTEKGWDKLL